MSRGFFSVLQLKKQRFKRNRGRQLLSVCFDVGVVALHGVWLEMCVIDFFVRLISDKAPFSKVNATSHLLNCKDNLNFWQNEYTLRECICVCVAFHFSWTHFLLPRAPSAETRLLFFWFRPCLCWISVIELVSYCVWSTVCREKSTECVWKPPQD